LAPSDPHDQSNPLSRLLGYRDAPARVPDLEAEKMKKVLDITSTVLVTVAAALFLWSQIEQRWLRPLMARSPQDATGLRIEARQIRNTKGSGDVALVEFTDYECPFCGAHARGTSLQIEKQLVESGAIRYVLFNFPLEHIHPHARQAGEAAECAARQGRYWEMHRRLFSDPSAVVQDLMESAKAVGLDSAVFSRCMKGEAAATITADLAMGRSLGVSTTPTFFVGMVQPDGSIGLAKRLSGARSFDVFQNLIETVSAMKRSRR
jgi:protein-disulfide isomerase